jgi:hypothetical protein
MNSKTEKHYLIINSDDFGRSTENMAEIFAAMREKIISSTSMFCTISDFDQVIEMIGSQTNLPVGVHLDFSFGVPVLSPSKIPSLTDFETGRFLPLQELSKRISAGVIVPEELKIEFQAQIERMRDAGIKPTHIDNHRPEIYFSPSLFEVVISLAREYKIPFRYPLSNYQLINNELAKSTGTSTDYLYRLHRSYVCNDKSSKFPRHPDGFFLMPRPGEGTNLTEIENCIRNSPSGIFEICCHIDCDERGQHDLQLLSSLQWRNFLEKEEIELVTYEKIMELNHDK